MQEEWRDIASFEGVYQISNFGRVRSLTRTVNRESQGSFTKEGKILKFDINHKGYPRIMLSLNGKLRNKLVHLLVADAFIDNKHNKTQINHINGNKSDNRVSNLEWVTPSENLQHAYDTGLRKSNAKLRITCNELNITTIGCVKMETELKKLGYIKASASAIFSCIKYDKNHSHLGLTFTLIDTQKEIL